MTRTLTLLVLIAALLLTAAASPLAAPLRSAAIHIASDIVGSNPLISPASLIPVRLACGGCSGGGGGPG